MTQWKRFLSHRLANRITAVPLSTLGDSTGSLILPNRVLIKASHFLAPRSASAALQYPPATSLINNMCWVSTCSERHRIYHPDSKGSGKGRGCIALLQTRDTVRICRWLGIIETYKIKCGFHRRKRPGLFVFAPQHFAHRCHYVYLINLLFLLGSMKL